MTAPELDVSPHPVLARHIEDALSGGATAIVVDLSHVDFLPPAG
jgi:anti-anti-sigma regulatory factor